MPLSGMLGYSWITEFDELTPDDVIVDYSYLSDGDFLLIVLLTSKGDIQVLYEVGDEPAKRRIINIRALWGRPIEPVAVCISPEASFIVFALSLGDMLIVPIRLILEVPWGSCRYLSESSPTFIPVTTSTDSCLRLPTCVMCYTSRQTHAPIVVFSNKAGQMLIVDILTRKLTIELQAPESIHFIDIFSHEAGVDLLVTGFTGAQFVVPLETGEHGLRETLGMLVPSDLRPIDPPTVTIARSGEGVMRMDNSLHEAQLFPSLRAALAVAPTPAPVTFKIPHDSWSVLSTHKVLFSLSHHSSVKYLPFFGMNIIRSCLIEWRSVNMQLEWRPLGIVPRRETSSLAQAFIVSERSLIRLLPDAEGVIYSSFPQTYQLKEVFALLGLPPTFASDKLIPWALESGKEEMGGKRVNKLLSIARHNHVSLEDVLALFEKHGVDHLLLSQVMSYVEEHPADALRHKVVALFVKSLADPRNTRNIDDVDVELSSFLSKSVDVVGDYEGVVGCSLWRSVRVLLPRCPPLNALLVSHLAHKGSSIWQHSTPETRSLMLCCLWLVQWDGVGDEECESVFSLLAEWQHHIDNQRAHERSMAIALANRNRTPAASMLYAVSAVYVQNGTSPVPCSSSSLIATGANVSLAYTVDRKLMCWGDMEGRHISAIEKEGQNETRPPTQHNPTPVHIDASEVCMVCAGSEHVVVLTSSGRLLSWGRNRFGQCGVGHLLPLQTPTVIEGDWVSVVSLSAGQFHNGMVLRDGRVLTWGWGLYGQLGHYLAGDATAPRTIPTEVQGLQEKMVSISCGRVHTVLLSESRCVWAAGGGTYGQMGTLSDPLKQTQFVKIPLYGCPIAIVSTRFYHTVAVSMDGRIFEWGRNPQELKMKMFVMRRLRNAQEKKNSDKKPPLPQTVPKDFLGVTEVLHNVDGTITQVSTGLSHSAIITDRGTLYTWGKGLDFQLGHGTKSERSEPLAVSLAESLEWSAVQCGANHVLATTRDGRVWSWGRNDLGQCGVPSGKQSNPPRKYFYQSKEGAKKYVQLSDDSAFVCVPTLVPSIVVLGVSDAVDRSLFISSFRSLDEPVLISISRVLSSCTIFSLLRAFLHLLAGDVAASVDVLCRVSAPLRARDTLLSIIWDVIANHEDCQTRSIVKRAMARLPRSSRTLQSRQLRALWPAVWDEEDAQTGLGVSDRLGMLGLWAPSPSVATRAYMGGSSTRSMGGRVVVFTECGHSMDARRGSHCLICLEEFQNVLSDSLTS